MKHMLLNWAVRSITPNAVLRDAIEQFRPDPTDTCGQIQGGSI